MSCLIRTLLFILLPAFSMGFSKPVNQIHHNPNEKSIKIKSADGKLFLTIDYNRGCIIKQLNLNGSDKLSPQGVFTGFTINAANFTSAALLGKINISETINSLSINNIQYGDDNLQVSERWRFNIQNNCIIWNITRKYNKNAKIEEIAFPSWNFTSLTEWKGGIFDNGGMVWCKYLQDVNDTYGVHTGGVTFWNEQSADALRIAAKPSEGNEIAAKYTHGEAGQFRFDLMVTDTTLNQRYNLSRFVSKKADVFAPFTVKAGEVSIAIELGYVNYEKEYSRGILPGIDAIAVRELLNTTGRYGVVDNNIIGANGWLTNWKCLHEPFFAQIGMALNDVNYTKNMSATLDQERDLAMLQNGRVLSRWHNARGDEIQGTYNDKTGYYEAMWGYTIDSQTGYIINTSEQFALNGDLKWLRAHQKSAEKALHWLINRDANNNGIFEMVNKNISEAKASDWLDIVWASYENAFVNAQMYEALTLWSECEKTLGNPEKASYYYRVALKLKRAFNKPVEEGGFWSADKKQYVYWRDDDGSVHGDNLVTPVNFAAIAFGLCDDQQRISLILDQIEKRTSAEQLFHWPLCFDSFRKEEVHANNWPFPKYENGDIFPTWGYLGVRAYAKYDKSIALKYINNILEQYRKDGLSSQRYSRTTQLGLGDDILAGISTSITALYRDIYGIRPYWNRMGLEPNMSASLNGTQFNYKLRGITYNISLSVNDYTIKTSRYTVKSKEAFGVAGVANTLIFFPHNRDKQQLSVTEQSGKETILAINKWEDDKFEWTAKLAGTYKITLKGLVAGSAYTVSVGGVNQRFKADKDGILTMSKKINAPSLFMVKKVA
ncbi:MAG: hypothetical protein V4687_02235 [Bacteroidota bacterium]